HLVGDQGLADLSRAFFLPDMRLVFLPEIADGGEHRVGRRLPQTAKGGLFDEFGHPGQPVDVPLPAVSGGDAFQYFHHPEGAFPAGGALAAGFILGEVDKVFGHVHHAIPLVHDDHAAGAHDGTQGPQRIIVHRGVQVRLRDAAAGGAAGLHCLEGLAPGNAAADVEDHLPQGDAQRDFTRPVLFTLPTSAKTVVPLLDLVPKEPYHLAPRTMMGAMWDQVLTLLMMVGLPHKPFWAGNGGRGRGSPTLPSMEAMREVSSPQTKAPAPSRIFRRKEKALPKILSPNNPSFSAWAMAIFRR